MSQNREGDIYRERETHRNGKKQLGRREREPAVWKSLPHKSDKDTAGLRSEREEEREKIGEKRSSPYMQRRVVPNAPRA